MLAQYGVGICLLYLDGKHKFLLATYCLLPHRFAAAFRAISDLCSGVSFEARAFPPFWARPGQPWQPMKMVGAPYRNTSPWL